MILRLRFFTVKCPRLQLTCQLIQEAVDILLKEMVTNIITRNM